MRDGRNFYLKRISVGMLLSVAVIFAVFVYNRSVLPGTLFLYETLPFYSYNQDNAVTDLFALKPGGITPAFAETPPDTGLAKETDISFNTPVYINPEPVPAVIGANGVIFQPESITDTPVAETASPPPSLQSDTLLFDRDKLSNFDYLQTAIYSIERNKQGSKATDMTAELFNAEKFLGADLRISQTGSEPKILIFSTHSSEMFADSNPNNPYDGVFGLGQKLKDILFEKYGIAAIHHTERYDILNGEVQILGAYERMEPDILQILKENPSIEVVIDIHRDGVGENVRLVTDINGERAAKIMFVNGLSSVFQNGRLTSLSYLPNKNQAENLAMSFNLQLAAQELYPSLCRKIYLKPYRYSLHMMPKSVLVEIGAQTNTVSEAFNAIELFADVLAQVLGLVPR